LIAELYHQIRHWKVKSKESGSSIMNTLRLCQGTLFHIATSESEQISIAPLKITAPMCVEVQSNIS